MNVSNMRFIAMFIASLRFISWKEYLVFVVYNIDLYIVSV